ncbi:MAG: methyltransferase domain-containing protein [Balneolaceae bacterium]|nr:MAG: methyltransferase domain-containing protein [Balneolaceae bacterium]
MNNTKPGDGLKQLVLEKYDKIGQSSLQQKETGGCCGPSGCATIDYEVFADDYSQLSGYNKDADLGLGCGLPTEHAHIQPGDTVVDLGSGAGNDCFVARQITGESGRVIGVDFSPSMVQKARENAAKVGFTNVEFVQGDIEEMPLEDEIADVVVSNCVLNLVPDKMKAFTETYRILKPGGHFSISDVVTIGRMPEDLKHHAEMFAGCVSGAMDQDEYLDIVKKAGFKNLIIQKSKEIKLPDEVLRKTLNEAEYQQFLDSNVGIYSITLYGEK